jgi:hypothetical protein
MKNGDIFFLSVFITIIVARLSVVLFPESDIYIFGLNFHHFWTGLIIILLSLFLIKTKSSLGIVIFGIGAGLVSDQLVFMLLGGGGDKEYWSFIPTSSVVIIICIIFCIRKYLSFFVETKK